MHIIIAWGFLFQNYILLHIDNKMKIFDLHNDLVTFCESYFEKSEYIGKIRKAGSKVLYAIWSTKLDVRSFYEYYDFLSSTADMFSVEDAKIVQNDLLLLKNTKFKSCSLTWNYDNELAGGAFGKNGISEKGIKFINALNDNGIALDVSHLNDKSFYESADVAKKILASHSGMRVNKNHCRNLSPEQIERIVSKDGLVGVTPVPDFVCGGCVLGYLNTIDEFIKRYGYEKLAIGTDFYGNDGIDGLRDYDSLIDTLSTYISERYGENVAKAVLYVNAENFFEA